MVRTALSFSDHKAVAKKFKCCFMKIIRLEEWSNVLFVVIEGLGARFVSKKCRTEYTDRIQYLTDLSDEEFAAQEAAARQRHTDAFVQRAKHVVPLSFKLVRKIRYPLKDIFTKRL
jgi:hypothetical protein